MHPFKTSSTRLAAFFSGWLAFAFFLLACEIYAITHGAALNIAFTLTVLAIIALTSLGLFVISFYVTRRINAIAATAHAIIATRDLSQRIPIASHWDDFSKLSGNLNLMLADIEQLVASVKQVSDNIAHDLRTPLTRMRNRIEYLRTGEAGNITAEDLTGLSRECDGLLATFNALLRIAMIEARRHPIPFTAVNLANILHDVGELYEPLAGEKSIHFTCCADPVTLMGDKDMLFQAFANLLDNAIKYTPQGGAVSATLVRHAGGSATLTLTDTGPGIPDSHKPNVFRRFYRVDTCRNQPGSGLGLSLVMAVVASHHGRIRLSDHAPHGLCVTVTFQASPTISPA